MVSHQHCEYCANINSSLFQSGLRALEFIELVRNNGLYIILILLLILMLVYKKQFKHYLLMTLIILVISFIANLFSNKQLHFTLQSHPEDRVFCQTNCPAVAALHLNRLHLSHAAV